MKQKVLILGGSGLVGTALSNEMKQYNNFEVYLTYFHNLIRWNQDRSFQLDIAEPDSISSILDTIKPKIIVSCLRGDFKQQLKVHTESAKYLKSNEGRLYFFSTTNVFDHDCSKPHYEDDLPNSQTDYGQFKIECEKKMIEVLQEHACILRLPQIWGKISPRMIELLNSLNSNKEIVVYPRLFHNTNTDVMIAKQVCYIIRKNLKGIFHLASDNTVNYKEFYSELAAGLGFHDVKMKEDLEEEGYFALLSRRSSEFPEEFRITNQGVIKYLIN